MPNATFSTMVKKKRYAAEGEKARNFYMEKKQNTYDLKLHVCEKNKSHIYNKQISAQLFQSDRDSGK